MRPACGPAFAMSAPVGTVLQAESASATAAWFAPFEVKLDPAEEIRRMGARNFGLHLKDHDNKSREDVVYGRGALNVLSVLQALRAVARVVDGIAPRFQELAYVCRKIEVVLDDQKMHGFSLSP